MDAVNKIRKIQELLKELGDESPELTAELKSILRETVMGELRDQQDYPMSEPMVPLNPLPPTGHPYSDVFTTPVQGPVVAGSQQAGELVVEPPPKKGRSLKMATGPYFVIDLDADQSQAKILRYVFRNPHASVEGMKKIADTIGVHAATISPTVSRLRSGGFLGGTVDDLVFISTTGRRIPRKKISANLILAGRISEALQTYGSSSAESLIEHLKCSKTTFYRAILHLLNKSVVTKMGKLYCLVGAK